MASQYFAILTDYGTTAFANALSSKQPLQLTTFAVGDGNGQAVTPTANRTALAREKHRAPVSAVSLDPRNKKQVIVELTIPENVGGFYIREMGVFDNQNKLVAYANCPESFKPTESSGSGKVQVLRMILKVSSSSAVTLGIDHSVIFVTRQQLNPKTITAATQNCFDETGHTHEIDRATTAKAGIVQLSNDDNSDDETKAPTLKAIKKLKGLYDGLRRLLDSYIPNSKKSNAVNSPSSETVATSAAVKTAYDKGVEAKTAADNAQRTADEAVHFNRNYFAGDLNTLNDKHEICYLEQAHTKNRNFPSDAYQWGILHVYSNGTLGSQVYYADNGELWARTRWHSHDWNNWKRLDRLDNVSKSGDTMTGNLTIDTADSLLKGKRNGTNKYAIGLRNSSSDDAVFINYTYDTVLELLRDAIRSNKTLIAAGMTIENSDYAGVSLKNLSGRYVRIEGNPHSAANMLTFVYREANGSNINVVGLPRKNGTLLLDNDLVGEVGFFARATPPSGWLKANGAAVSRTTYAALFAAIGATFGAGDGRTTFNLPDLRGEFLRGLDDGRNIDSNRRLGSWQKGTIEGFDGLDATSVFGVGLVRDGAYNTLTLEESVTLVGADHTTYDDVREIALKWAGGGGARATNNSADREGGFWTKNNKNPVKSSHFAGMTRPRNIALLACIKY